MEFANNIQDENMRYNVVLYIIPVISPIVDWLYINEDSRMIGSLLGYKR